MAATRNGEGMKGGFWEMPNPKVNTNLVSQQIHKGRSPTSS